MENKKVLLSVKDLHVKFRVRGRILTAIRGISLDLYENESVAIVGESGSGKSVFTKTFAGMLDSNGFISEGSILFNDPELSDTKVRMDSTGKSMVNRAYNYLNKASSLEFGAEIFNKMQALKAQAKAKGELTEEENEALTDKIAQLRFDRTELYNLRQTIDSRKEKARYHETGAQLKQMDAEIESLQKQRDVIVRQRQAEAKADKEYLASYAKEMAQLKADYNQAIKQEPTEEMKARNLIIAKEIYLSIGRYGFVKREKLLNKLLKVTKKAMEVGVDLSDDEQKNQIFDQVVFRVKYLDENEPGVLHGDSLVNLAKVKYSKDWTQIRGGKIATVFQDPMTSLNPIITIGKQITSVILKHQNCTETEARRRALILMKKVGIPNAEDRFDDYPFQYSGGMRQRIVIAIALSCQPKILICDEPTTALDVTIQAQILDLIKDLQKQLGMSVILITHDLGVVAEMCDEVIVMYAGEVCERGTADEIFYNPKHEYTKGLMRSIPTVSDDDRRLEPIGGTPVDLLNMPDGCPFAPRCDNAMKVCLYHKAKERLINNDHMASCWHNVKDAIAAGELTEKEVEEMYKGE